jgi:hypothetical protein
MLLTFSQVTLIHICTVVCCTINYIASIVTLNHCCTYVTHSTPLTFSQFTLIQMMNCCYTLHTIHIPISTVSLVDYCTVLLISMLHTIPLTLLYTMFWFIDFFYPHSLSPGFTVNAFIYGIANMTFYITICFKVI